jgi:hypothetical protein
MSLSLGLLVSNLDRDFELHGMFMKDIYYLFGLVIMIFTSSMFGQLWLY